MSTVQPLSPTNNIKSGRNVLSRTIADGEFGRGCTRVISPRLLMMTVPRVCGGYTHTPTYPWTNTRIHERNFARTYSTFARG